MPSSSRVNSGSRNTVSRNGVDLEWFNSCPIPRLRYVDNYLMKQLRIGRLVKERFPADLTHWKPHTGRQGRRASIRLSESRSSSIMCCDAMVMPYPSGRR